MVIKAAVIAALHGAALAVHSGKLHQNKVDQPHSDTPKSKLQHQDKGRLSK